ncbi:hypothetical protein Hamer_G001672, partial [Homarus americanus]
EDHGEASQVNIAESHSVNDELRLLESQVKLKEAEAIAREVGIHQAETEAIAKRVGIRQVEAEAKEELDAHCGKPGHKAEFCWTRLQLNTGKSAMNVTEETNTSPVGAMANLRKADSMPFGLVFTKGEENFAKDPDVGTFRPFLSQGTVEVDGVETPITILRESGCLQTLIKEGVVVARKTVKYVILGSFWGQGGAPLVLVRVKSSCFSGIANVACVHELSVAGVDLILGNDLAGESTAELQQLEDDMPGVFPLCAVTRFMSMTNDHNVTPDVDDSLSLEGVFADPIASQDISSAVYAVTGRVALIAEQEQDDSLRLLFDSANDSGPTTRY